MHKGRVLSFKDLKCADFLTKNSLFIFFIAVFCTGVFLGACFLHNSEFFSGINANFLKQFIFLRDKGSFFSVFMDFFIKQMFVLMLIFSVGSGFLGVIFVPVNVLICGAVYGSFAALLYKEYSVNGIALNAIFILPASLFFFAALLLASSESFKLSVGIVKMTFPGKRVDEFANSFKSYCVKFSLYSLLVVASAVVEGLMSVVFWDNFKL